jgi:hypothetical protein
MTTTIQFKDVCIDAEGAVLIGESLDNFRALARKPGFPKAEKVGGVNFRNRAALLAYKRQRDAARKAK